ncbi:MAG: heavy-metal-associated domain-containing protein [Snowella sp.]|nr:heavy-metal-associated domain-containing protein [Snowella sp.]
MSVQLTVSSIACDACATAITNAIQQQFPDAQVDVDVPTKLVTVKTAASEAAIKQAITEAGHEVAQ